MREFFNKYPKVYSHIYKSLLLAGVLFTIYYVVIIAFLPVSNYRYIFPEKQNAKTNKINHDLSWYYAFDDSLLNTSIDQANKEAFLLARLEMAKNDSISMAVDLKDSTITLLVQGVTIFKTKLLAYDCSNYFNKIDPFVTSQFFSWPFIVEEYSASIPKIPLIIKKAPKDTIEAASPPAPGQLEESQQLISFQLSLDRKLNILFEQDSLSYGTKNKSYKQYIHQQKKVSKKAVRMALIRGSPIEYIPQIKIRLNRQDALIIFRAIPEKVKVAIRIDYNY